MTYEEHAAKVRKKLGKVLSQQERITGELCAVDDQIADLERHRKHLLRQGRILHDRWSRLMTELYSEPDGPFELLVSPEEAMVKVNMILSDRSPFSGN